ncbi:MAG: hypothetical protein JSR90_03555 [Proteobacteria bacterium]|nr:hypothetical protein [Pseudomonadota bacterium]
MADPSEQAGGAPEVDPPAGTSRRIRKRAVWAVSLFAASVIPTIVGVGMTLTPGDHVNIAFVFALAFWGAGVLMALTAAFPTLRHWDALPAPTRWLGVLPMLTISLFLSVALVLASLP